MTEQTIRIHLIWVIGILIALIAGVLLYLPNGQALTSYVSFASSIASLILAVVAIFYSIISNQGFFQSIGALQNASHDMKAEAERIATDIVEFGKKSDELLGQISSVPGSVKEMSDTLNSRLDNITERRGVDGSEVIASESKLFNGKRGTVGTDVALYIIAKASKSDIQFELDEFLDDDIMNAYVSGVLTTIALSEPAGVKISFVKSQYGIEEVGKLDVDRLLRLGSSMRSPIAKQYVAKIDEYFEKESARFFSQPTNENTGNSEAA